MGGIAIVRRDYREDIDWLRAIAVLAVVAFHFEAPAVYGGFVGVDIFFVISGYLITGIIQSEVKDGSFSFAQFYERRVRRLLPALYAMVALTAIPSFHYLLTSERAEFFRSVAAVVTFTSNFFFWFQTGYFDHAAVEKPLLHTWSLAVEEQFYLALPLLLWALLACRARQPRRAAGSARRADAGLVCALHLADAHRPLRDRLLHEPAAGLGISGRRPRRDPGLSGAAPRAGAANRPRHRAGAARDPDLLAAAGAGISRLQRADAVHRRDHVHLERHRRADAEARRDIRRSISQNSSGRFPIRSISGTGRCSPSRGSRRSSLVLDASDKIALFALTVAISYLSWRFVEQPFRATARWRRRAAPRSASRALQFGGSAGRRAPSGIVVSQTPSDSRPRRAAAGILQHL